jgi:hypothetical protein
MIDRHLPTQALDLLEVDRWETHGDPMETHRRVAAMWSAYLGSEVTPDQVAMCMVMVKIARSASGYARDDYLDSIGYMVIAEGLARPC